MAGAEPGGQAGDFAIAFDSAFAALRVCVESACADAGEWPAGVAAGVHAAFEWTVRQPLAAQLLTNEALAGGRAGFECHERLIAYLAELFAHGRELSPGAGHLPEVTERGLANGVVMLAAQRLALGREAELPALAPESIQFVLTPYLGSEEAQRVAGVG